MTTNRRNVRFSVAPRYTAGSPAAVSWDIARQVAADERAAYEHAKTGVYGEADKRKAETLGLDMIVYELHETSKGWNVQDMITDRQWFWPFEGRCSGCKHRQRLQQGILRAHVSGNPAFNPCASDTFLGRELIAEARFRSHFAAFTPTAIKARRENEDE